MLNAKLDAQTIRLHGVKVFEPLFSKSGTRPLIGISLLLTFLFGRQESKRKVAMEIDVSKNRTGKTTSGVFPVKLKLLLIVSYTSNGSSWRRPLQGCAYVLCSVSQPKPKG